MLVVMFWYLIIDDENEIDFKYCSEKYRFI